MANEVEWIKLTTGMFDNGKIKQLRTLPDGNNIVLMWIMLLVMAGKCNAGGMIILTENVPYTVEMIANETGIPQNTVTLGLDMLEQFKMISRENDCFVIKNWYEYQNETGPEKLREQTRQRVAKHREKKKLECNDCNVTRNVTVTQSSYSYSSSNSSSYSFSKHSNIENYEYVLSTYKDKEYIELNHNLNKCIQDWLSYKDELKPKSSNHYESERGLTTLLNTFVKNDKEFGTDAIIEVVNFSMGNQYKGIIWDRLCKKNPPKQESVLEKWGKLL